MEPQKTPQSQSSANNPAEPETATQPSGLPPFEDVAQSTDPVTAQPATGKVFQPTSPEGDPKEPGAATTPWTPDAAAVVDNAAASQTSQPGSPASPVASSMDSEAVQPPASPDAVVDPLPVSSPKRQKKGLLFGLIIAAVLLLLSGGAAASYYYLVNKPENVLKQALANAMDTEKTKTLHFSGSATVEAEGGTEVGATYTGAVDNKSGAFDVSGKVDVVVANITFDFRSTDAKTFYLRLGGLGGLPELLSSTVPEAAMYAPVISALNDQWVEINDSLLKEFDGSYESGILSDADIQKVTDAYLQYPFLTVSEVLADETVGGEDSHHYKLVIDAAKLKSFLSALKDAKLDSYKLDQNTLNRYNKAIDQAKLSKYPFEIWISKGSKMIKQFSFTYSAEGASLKARFTVDSYNQPVEVEKPKDTKSLMELLSEVFGTNLAFPMPGQESGISL